MHKLSCILQVERVTRYLQVKQLFGKFKIACYLDFAMMTYFDIDIWRLIDMCPNNVLLSNGSQKCE